MEAVLDQLTALRRHGECAAIRVQTLGGFQVWREEQLITAKEWGRDKTIQLFQFLVTARQRRGLHKEQIIDRIWEDVDLKTGEQTFKVAMHGLNKVLEPHRAKRTEPRFILRQGITYQLNLDDFWIDTDALEAYIALGNQAVAIDKKGAIEAYRAAITLHHGVYLPNRLYEDWSSEERERIQVLTLGAMVTLGELILKDNPMESIRLAQKALQIDHAWEDAYRIQMAAYFERGNRPMVIKTFRQCEKVLEEEFGLQPLPETKQLYERVRNA